MSHCVCKFFLSDFVQVAGYYFKMLRGLDFLRSQYCSGVWAVSYYRHILYRLYAISPAPIQLKLKLRIGRGVRVKNLATWGYAGWVGC